MGFSFRVDTTARLRICQQAGVDNVRRLGARCHVNQITFRAFPADGTEVCPTLEHTHLELEPPDPEPPELHLVGP